MAFKEKYTILSITLFLLIGCISGQNTCGSFNTYGYTVPLGDIVLEYGEDLNITCSLRDKFIANNEEDDSSKMYFTRNNDPVPSQMTDVINSTSIRLHFAKHPKTKGDNYYCLLKNRTSSEMNLRTKVKDDMLCMNVVVVGVPPQDVTDFSCLSRNYENLTCTWTAPENFVKTEYNLTYYLRLRAARSNKKRKRPETKEQDRFVYNCPKIEKLENGQLSCFWNVRTDPQYRQSHSTYFFRLSMNNTFGSKINNFTFEHFKRVLPNPPENLTAVATSPHSVRLTWVIPSAMVNFQTGLQHRILYQCEYYEKVWQFGALITDPEKTVKKFHEYELQGLKYAHALCDIRVSMRSKLADPNDESMWSQNATKTVRTKSKLPDGPPKTNIGCFEIVNRDHNREVYVYWQQLKEEEKNGQNFSYYVEVENYPSLKPEISRTYAKFPYLSDTDYIVHIKSVNEEGFSLERSTVIVPARRLHEPLSFTKEEHHKENLYELSWDRPQESESVITNYTIFWCSNVRDRPYQCEGILNWTTVPKDMDRWNQTLSGDGIYQFAISANSHDSSSGMIWAECTLIPNMGVGKMKTVWINRVGSDYIEVGWKLDCVNRKSGTINGFIIYYCPIESPIKNSCKKTTEKNVTIEGDVNLQSGIVTELKPYTTYRLSVSFIINHSTYSQNSDPLYNTTNEGTPTPPQNIRVINVTNSTASIRWESPQIINGVLKKYLVHYKNDTNLSLTIEPDKTEAVIPDLMSFQNYSITVEACTVLCSEASPPITIETKMWLPDKIDNIKIVPNISHVIFTWNRPKYPRGKLDYYQVKYTQKLSFENKTTIPYENVTAQNFSIESCESGKYDAVFVSVRAVNIIDGNHKPGPWSDEQFFPCGSQYSSVVYILVGVSVLVIALATTCVFKRVYVSIKYMKNIDVVLPPGLDQKVVNDSINKIGADEEYLLNKIKDGIRSSGDSSSSGHESITSSSESTAHITPSDSGTEQPRSPALSEDRKSHSLRQRNVPAQRPTINKGYVLPDAVPITGWSQKPTPVSAGNYCVLGVDPSTQTETNSPFVPQTDVNTIPFSCDMSQPPPPYVVTGDFIKTPNPGYVSYPIAEPTDKNTGYVVAGLTKDLVTPDLLQCDTPKPTVVEEKPLYVRAAEVLPNIKGVQFPWQQPSLETSLPKTGYVSVGDAPPPKTMAEVTKGYVPHRQFEAKSIKED